MGMVMSWTRARAVERVKEYNARGLSCSLSLLPVIKYSKQDARTDVGDYLALLHDIHARGLNADITVKVMQFGALAGRGVAGECLKPVMEEAARKKIRVWFDQDFARNIPDVLQTARAYSQEHVGVCLQAYHTRTHGDVHTLSDYPIRLVKGFYNDYDIRPWIKVGKNYSALMDTTASQSSYPCFGTHDLRLIEKAKTLLRGREGEIQFFAGVRDNLAEELTRDGYKVRIYVPYGNAASFLWHNIAVCDLPRAIQRLFHIRTIY